MASIKKRLIPCILIVVITLGCVLLSRPTRVLFFLALAVISAFELEQVLLKADMRISKWYLIAYIVIHGVLCLLRIPSGWLIALFVLFAFGGMAWAVLRPGKCGIHYAVGTLFTMMWPYAFYAVILYICASSYWLPVLTCAILGAWMCDCFALLGGMLLKGPKMAPVVSPKKTWSGAIVGGIFAIVTGFAIYFLLGDILYIAMWPCVITTFVASCFGQIGDLAASLVKRTAGVKDYGHLMPEHGGIMDKTDSMLFAIPAAYLCLQITVLIYSAA